MKKILILTLLGWVLIGASVGQSATTSSISQHGVTWTFDRAYEYGTFANGDYWVIGPVTITSISPAFTGTRGGWEVNPTAAGTQGFDANANLFDAKLVPALPYTAAAGQSIVKQVPNTSPNSNSVTTAMAVLTVVGAVPPASGSSIFRPPYAGNDKSYYSTSSIQTNRLLSIPTVSQGVSYSDLAKWFNRPHIEIGEGGSARKLRGEVPNEYGPAVAGAINAAIAKMNSTDSISSKWQTLIWLIQAGIDRYHCVLTGQTWPGGTGHEPGHKLSVAFSAYMLDHSGMKNEVAKAFWWENRMVQNGLWGSNASEMQYWSYMALDPGYNLEYADPYRSIDGGNNITRKVNSYQTITAHNIKGAACWLRYYPDMKAWWSDAENFIAYAERWVARGLKALPDSCASMDPSDVGKTSSNWRYYGVTYGPDGSGSCIKGTGRFNDGRNGMSANEGQYQSSQVNEMWDLMGKGSYSGGSTQPPILPTQPQNLRIGQ